MAWRQYSKRLGLPIKKIKPAKGWFLLFGQEYDKYICEMASTSPYESDEELIWFSEQMRGELSAK